MFHTDRRAYVDDAWQEVMDNLVSFSVSEWCFAKSLKLQLLSGVDRVLCGRSAHGFGL